MGGQAVVLGLVGGVEDGVDQLGDRVLVDSSGTSSSPVSCQRVRDVGGDQLGVELGQLVGAHALDLERHLGHVGVELLALAALDRGDELVDGLLVRRRPRRGRPPPTRSGSRPGRACRSSVTRSWLPQPSSS